MTLPDGYDSGKKPQSGSSLKGAVALVVIVLIISVFAANWIWDAAHDTSGGGTPNVEIELVSCKATATGSTETVVKISNYNDFDVIVEWLTIGGTGYANVDAKTFVHDQLYIYDVTSCSAVIESVTKR